MARSKTLACSESECCICREHDRGYALDDEGGLLNGLALVEGRLICVACTISAVRMFAEIAAGARALAMQRACLLRRACAAVAARRQRVAAGVATPDEIDVQRVLGPRR
jgi:hypothetical protein